MEGCEIFVEIGAEEVQVFDTVARGRGIVLQNIVEVPSRFGCDGPGLLVAPGISWNEKYGYSLDLDIAISTGRQSVSWDCYTQRLDLP